MAAPPCAEHTRHAPRLNHEHTCYKSQGGPASHRRATFRARRTAQTHRRLLSRHACRFRLVSQRLCKHAYAHRPARAVRIAHRQLRSLPVGCTADAAGPPSSRSPLIASFSFSPLLPTKVSVKTRKVNLLGQSQLRRHCERGMGVAMRVGVLCSLMAVTRAFGVVARTGGVSAMRRPRPLATGTRALVASSSPRRSPRKSSPAPGAPAPEAAPSNSARAERPAPPSLLGSHLRHIMVADDFLEPVLADAMRKTFDDRFREPRTTLSERFVWVR